MKKQITIRPDESKKYFSAETALKENGFEYQGRRYGEPNPVSGRVRTYEIFYHRDFGEYYYLHSIDNFDTTIFKIVVKLLPKPLGHYWRN